MMECFADKIFEIYMPGDIIMVHDYHLMMLPRLLRQRLPGAHLAFSLHTPCPRTLATSGPLREVIEGILGSNIITFQAPEDAMDFVGWCAQNPSDRPSYWATRAMDSCIVVPMGIDVPSVISVAQSEAVSEKCKTLRRAFKDRKVVFSYNTLDSETEMEEIAVGFSRMLAQMPRRKEPVILLQVVCTSRTQDALEEHPTSIIDELAGTGELARMMYFKGHVSELDFHALVRSSDAAIFSYTRGGPITAALEYFVCQPRDSKRPIVSDINPVFQQLPGSITYRRGDLDSIARAIDYALGLPSGPSMGTPRLEEYDFGMINTAEHWTNCVLRDLTEKLLLGRPAGTFDTGACGPCSPEEFAGA